MLFCAAIFYGFFVSFQGPGLLKYREPQLCFTAEARCYLNIFRMVQGISGRKFRDDIPNLGWNHYGDSHFFLSALLYLHGDPSSIPSVSGTCCGWGMWKALGAFGPMAQGLTWVHIFSASLTHDDQKPVPWWRQDRREIHVHSSIVPLTSITSWT